MQSEVFLPFINLSTIFIIINYIHKDIFWEQWQSAKLKEASRRIWSPALWLVQKCFPALWLVWKKPRVLQYKEQTETFRTHSIFWCRRWRSSRITVFYWWLQAFGFAFKLEDIPSCSPLFSINDRRPLVLPSKKTRSNLIHT